MADATLGYLSLSANSAGACLAGSTPHRGPAGAALEKAGEHAGEILSAQHKLLLAFGLNPLLDTHSVSQLSDNNEFVIAIGSFDNDFVQQQADLVLPLAAIFETSGSFVNVEGLWQSFKGCVEARGESRQGWKILCALGQVLKPGEFEYADTLAVRNELKDLCSELSLTNLCGIESGARSLPKDTGKLQKVGITPIYAGDDMTRLSAPLQATPLMRMQAAALMNRQQAKQSKLEDCEQVQVRQGKGTAVIPFRIDDSVPDGCVYIPGGIDAVRHLADAFGKIELERVS
jgi:NADH-quinone oxidoreductase subunit G